MIAAITPPCVTNHGVAPGFLYTREGGKSAPCHMLPALAVRRDVLLVIAGEPCLISGIILQHFIALHFKIAEVDLAEVRLDLIRHGAEERLQRFITAAHAARNKPVCPARAFPPPKLRRGPAGESGRSVLPQ